MAGDPYEPDYSAPVGQDLADAHPERYGPTRFPLVMRPLSRCPFCGHPQGACTHDDYLNSQVRVLELTRPDRKDEIVVLVEDAWENFYDSRLDRTRKRLAARKGDAVPRWRAELLGARHEQQQVVRSTEVK